MGAMSVRPEQVNGLAAQIRTGANGIREDLNTLESKIAPVRESWSGAAQAAYDEFVPGFEAVFSREAQDWPRFYDAVRRLGALPKEERRKALQP